MWHASGHGAPSVDGWPALASLVHEVLATRRAVAALQAREARLLASAVDVIADRAGERRVSGARSTADIPLREVSAELGAAMRVSDRTVQRRIGDAATLVDRFPATLRAWEEGRIDRGHVEAILDAGAGIGVPSIRERFELLALEAASADSAPRLRAAARALAAHVDPEGEQERRAAARSGRCVRVIDLGDDLARLVADVPATLAFAIHDRLTQIARSVREAAPLEAFDEGADLAHAGPSPTVTTGPGRPLRQSDDSSAAGSAAVESSAAGSSSPDVDGRTIDQLRADAFCDILLGGAPIAHGDGLDAVRGLVHVTVPALTLAGQDAGPALLAGFGPIDPDTARRLAGSAAGWDRVLSDPYTGAVLATDRYRPSADLVRLLRTRDECCRFPGCRRPAHRCDIDHTVDAAIGGATAERNLAHLCRRHHTLKHESAWRVRQRPGGVIEWTSPAGRRYRDRPAAQVRFVPSGGVEDPADPPPF